MTEAPSLRLPRARSAVGRWVGVAAVNLALHLGTPPWLAVPAPWHPGAASDAVRSLGPFLGTVAVGHLLLCLLGGYLLVLATISMFVCCGLPIRHHRTWLARLSLSLSLPGTRTLVAWVLGLATLTLPLTTTAAFAAAPGGDPGGPPALTWIGPPAAPPSMQVILPDRPTAPGRSADRSAVATPSPVTGAPPTTATTTLTTATPTSPTSPPGPAPGVPTDPPPPTTPETIVTAPATGIATNGPTGSTPAPAPAPAPWTVRPGDHLWSIAAATLTAVDPDDPPDEEAIAAYWWQVVTVNRPHLPNPADIDLLYPGDVVILPPLP